MASKSNPKTTTPPARQPVRQAITLEAVRHLAPHTGLALNLGTTFGLEVPDCEAIADATEETLGKHGTEMQELLSEKALELHMQRLVGAYVGSAHGAARFYSEKVSQARDLTSRLANDHRDEDRDDDGSRSYSGHASKAQSAREFAARMGLQAYALLAAAEGAASAYASLTGSEWKPYTPDAPASRGISRRSGDEEMAAFR